MTWFEGWRGLLNRIILSLGCLILVLSVPAAVCAGPPYITDDPEPMEHQHWEVYLASLFTKQPEVWPLRLLTLK